jgi:hypothetical protein
MYFAVFNACVLKGSDKVDATRALELLRRSIDETIGADSLRSIPTLLSLKTTPLALPERPHLPI